MKQAFTIGIDNGVTGSMAIIGPDGAVFEHVPTKQYLMGQTGSIVRRIDVDALRAFIATHVPIAQEARAYVERPFTGSPTMINTMLLSARAHEAVLIALEQLHIGTTTIDSREWQKPILGDVKGSPALKLASKLRGCALYPYLAASIATHGDADGLLIAHRFAKL
jgi:hypothetical protein